MIFDGKVHALLNLQQLLYDVVTNQSRIKDAKELSGNGFVFVAFHQHSGICLQDVYQRKHSDG